MNIIVRCIVSLLLVLLILALLPYLRYTKYTAAPDVPFSGDKWYNPYADLTDTLLRANFHAHSRAWAGLTWGENSTEEIINAYAERGYQVPSLSNYFSITERSFFRDPLVYVPAYEHGFNLRKVHCLCIGAEDVSLTEFPWHFNTDLTNRMIADLGKHCGLVALAHPGACSAHEPDEMLSLYGIQLMEVANTQGVRTAYWDAVLSAGRPVWFLADDDTHALDDGEAFMRWNMIYAARTDQESVISALRMGRHYGVASYDGVCDGNTLLSVAILNDTLMISTDDIFNRLDFIGQGGVQLQSVTKMKAGSYALKNSDSYVRVEIHHDHCVYYLNPVVRYQGSTFQISSPEVRIEWGPTIFWRVVLLGIIAVIVAMWFRVIRKNRTIKGQKKV